MFQILDKVLNKFALVYLDDVIIYSDTIKPHPAQFWNCPAKQISKLS
jgi:hypothetical protein